LDNLFRLLHPFVPFVTETLWTSLTGGESLVIANWPKPSGRVKDPAAEQWLANTDDLATQLRRFRADQGLPPSQRVPASFAGLTDQTIEAALRSLCRLSDPDDGFSASASIEVPQAGGRTVTIELDTSSTIDVAAEITRSEKDLALAQKELDDTAKRLGNPQFVERAKPQAVAKIRERAAKAESDVARLTERLAALRGQNR